MKDLVLANRGVLLLGKFITYICIEIRIGLESRAMRKSRSRPCQVARRIPTKCNVLLTSSQLIFERDDLDFLEDLLSLVIHDAGYASSLDYCRSNNVCYNRIYHNYIQQNVLPTQLRSYKAVPLPSTYYSLV